MCKICNYFCAVDCLILLLLIVNLYIYNLYFSTFHSIAIMLLCSLKLVFYSHLANLIDFFWPRFGLVVQNGYLFLSQAS